MSEFSWQCDPYDLGVHLTILLVLLSLWSQQGEAVPVCNLCSSAPAPPLLANPLTLTFAKVLMGEDSQAMFSVCLNGTA